MKPKEIADTAIVSKLRSQEAVHQRLHEALRHGEVVRRHTKDGPTVARRQARVAVEVTMAAVEAMVVEVATAGVVTMWAVVAEAVMARAVTAEVMTAGVLAVKMAAMEVAHTMIHSCDYT
jgi:hypothetical protein